MLSLLVTCNNMIFLLFRSHVYSFSLCLAVQANLTEVFGRKGCLRYIGALLWSFWLCGFLPRRLFCFCKRLKRQAATKPYCSWPWVSLCLCLLPTVGHGDLTGDFLWVAVSQAPAVSSKAGINKDCCSGLAFGKIGLGHTSGRRGQWTKSPS